MRVFCTYILLVTLTLQSFYRNIMAMDYQIHLTDYLAKCINLDRPQLHCDGQCVLMQKIKEKEQKEGQKNLVVYEYSALYVHKEYTPFAMDHPYEEVYEGSFPPYLIDYSFDFNKPIFRPPTIGFS